MSDELKQQSIDTPEFRNLLDRVIDAAEAGQNESATARGALIAHIDAWRVPAGHKLGPIESTAEMNILGRRALRNCGNDQASIHDAELCWSAMMAVASAPEQNQVEEK